MIHCISDKNIMSEKFPGGRRNITYRLNITYFL